MKSEEYTKDATKAISSNHVELEEDGTLYASMSGNQDYASLKALDDESSKILDSLSYKPNILVNMQFFDTPTEPNAIKLGIEVFNRDNYNYLVFFGMNEALNTIMTIMSKSVARNKHMKIFDTEKEARDWIAKNPAPGQS